MYFSNHNEAVTFSYTYGGPLEVEIDKEGPVCKEDTDVYPLADKDWTKEHNYISLTKGITEVKAGFLESFKNLNALIISRSVTKIEMTPQLKKLLSKNNVLIRGEYNTYAESFAKENGLKFLQADILLAIDCNEEHCENTFITLQFFPDGKANIKYDVFSVGISAGNNGGGTYERELPNDFWKGCTAEKFADNFPERLRETLLKNKELEHFLTAINENCR